MSGFDFTFGADRRTILAGAAMSAALLATRGAALAAEDLADVRKAIATGPRRIGEAVAGLDRPCPPSPPKSATPRKVRRT